MMIRTLSILLVTFLFNGCTPFTKTTWDPVNEAADAEALAESTNDGTFLIDLPTTLRLASHRNLDLAEAIEKANRASARADRALASILPDLAAGASFARQDGLFQDIAGNPIYTERYVDSAGFGVGTAGAGMGMAPGASLDVSIERIVFEPLAALQDRRAARAAAEARERSLLAEVATTYYELLRANATLNIERELASSASSLATLADQFAKVGEGLNSDARLTQARSLLRQSRLAQAEAAVERSGADLVQLLSLPRSITLKPASLDLTPIDLVDLSEPKEVMIAAALQRRPEAEELKANVAAATARLRQSQVAPFLPHFSATYSSYEFGAGVGDSVSRRDDREEVMAAMYWTLDGLGFGTAAQTRERRSERNLARIEETQTLDLMAREVVSLRADAIAHASRLSPMKTASEYAREAFDLNMKRLGELQGLPIETLTALQTLADTRLARANAILDYNIAHHKLLAALGGRPEFEPNAPFNDSTENTVASDPSKK